MLKQQFLVKNRWVGVGQPPFIIAEMACAHEGEPDRAMALVDAAVDAGADAVQLQIFTRSHQVPPHHRLFELLGKLEFSEKEWRAIHAYARTREIAVFVFAYDVPGLNLALELGVDGLKLSSADLSNPEMLHGAAESGVPVTLGTGASTFDEITDALRLMQASRAEEVVLMHGVQNFPTPLADAALRRIQLLQKAYALPVGYQDHTDAHTPESRHVDLIALGMGACMLEKHVTLDRAEKGTDHQAALEPKEFAEYVRLIRNVAPALGGAWPMPLRESDYTYRRFQKKKIVAARLIPQGSVIDAEALVFLRDEQCEGLSPGKASDIVGKLAVHDVNAFAPVREVDVV